jgi:hypothetical protein
VGEGQSSCGRLEVVGRRGGGRLGKGLTGGTRLSEPKKKKRGSGAAGGLAFAGSGRPLGLGPVGLACPFFFL